jgi:peptidoglycan/xylan/chitin deacetylase (PgdA/CDA1 family)
LKDVAVANSRSSSFSLIIRNPNGSFNYPTRDYVVEGGTPLAITSGDYNHSDMSDIAVASNAKNTIEIYLQRRVFK